jgi:PBP1b-binding outer membrane lipoprotein LpoB
MFKSTSLVALILFGAATMVGCSHKTVVNPAPSTTTKSSTTTTTEAPVETEKKTTTTTTEAPAPANQ